jgi:hypothetical protein
MFLPEEVSPPHRDIEISPYDLDITILLRACYILYNSKFLQKLVKFINITNANNLVGKNKKAYKSSKRDKLNYPI